MPVAGRIRKKKVRGMPGAFQTETEGGAVSPPQREKRKEFDEQGKKIGVQVPRFPLPGDVKVAKRSIGGSDVTDKPQAERELMARELLDKQAGAVEERTRLAKGEGAREVRLEFGLEERGPDEISEQIPSQDVLKDDVTAPQERQIPGMIPSKDAMSIPQQGQVPQAEAMAVEEEAAPTIVGVHAQALMGDEETSELDKWLDEEITIKGGKFAGPDYVTTRRESLKTGAKAAAILAAGAAAIAILSSAALAPVIKVASDSLIKTAAQLAGAKYPAAALEGTFIIRPSAVIWGATKMLGNTIFSWKGIAIGSAVTGANIGARSMASIAVADMKDQAAYVENGEKSYEDALSDFEWEDRK